MDATAKVVAGNSSDGNVALTPTLPPHMSDDLGKLASNAAWVVLPVEAVLQLKELHLSPPGVVPPHE